MRMRNLPFVLLGLFLLAPALAESAPGSRLCAQTSNLKAPAAPAPACAALNPTQNALLLYAREAIGTCAQADQRARADNAGILHACPAAGPDSCTQAMALADTHLADIDRGLQGLRARHEKLVQGSFPAQGAPIAGNCLNLLDAYQQFAYSVSGAVNDAVKIAQSDRVQIRQKMGALLEAQLLGKAH